MIYALPVFIDFNLHLYKILTFAYTLIYTMNRLHGSSNRKKVSLAICTWIFIHYNQRRINQSLQSLDLSRLVEPKLWILYEKTRSNIWPWIENIYYLQLLIIVLVQKIFDQSMKEMNFNEIMLRSICWKTCWL